MSKFEEYIKKYEDIHTGKSGFQTIVDGVVKKTSEHFGDGVEFVKKVFPYIHNLIEQKGRAVTILDYGCGQAFQTFNPSYPTWQNTVLRSGDTIHTYFKGMIQSYYCYDPAVPRYSRKPDIGTTFDMVVMADVLEHIPEEHVVDVLKEVFLYCKEDGVAIFTISGNLAYSHFEDGENAHITRRSMEWWLEVIKSACNGISHVVRYTNNEFYKETDGKINCKTTHVNSAKYQIPSKHEMWIKKYDK